MDKHKYLQKKYDVAIGTFTRNIVGEALMNADSFLFHETEGYQVGLLGHHKPLSQAIFGDYAMLAGIGTVMGAIALVGFSRFPYDEGSLTVHVNYWTDLFPWMVLMPMGCGGVQRLAWMPTRLCTARRQSVGPPRPICKGRGNSSVSSLKLKAT